MRRRAPFVIFRAIVCFEVTVAIIPATRTGAGVGWGVAAAAVWLIPGAWSAGGLVFAIGFAGAVKVALIEPFACSLQVFFKLTEGQVPDPE